MYRIETDSKGVGDLLFTLALDQFKIHLLLTWAQVGRIGLPKKCLRFHSCLGLWAIAHPGDNNFRGKMTNAGLWVRLVRWQGGRNASAFFRTVETRSIQPFIFRSRN